MIAVFVPVIIIPTQLTKVKTELSFAAKDPWNGNRPCTFTLDSYMVTLRGVKTLPKGVKTSRWLGGFHRALRSEADGVTRFLPESLIELWLTKQVPTEAMPALLKQIEPSLRKSDFKPILRSLKMKMFGIFESICCGLMMIIIMVAVVAGHAPWWLAAAIVLAAACVFWVFLHQVYFGLLRRRKKQIRWLLERMAAYSAKPAREERSQMTQNVIHDIKLEGQKIELANDLLPAGPETTEPRALRDFRFDAIMDVPEVMEPSMERRLIKAFPELKWEDPSENWGKVRLLGMLPETPERIVVSIRRREPPGPFNLGVTVSAKDQAEALNSLREIIHRLESALSEWSISNLPKFKARPPSGISMNQTEIVEPLFPPVRPHVTLTGPDADIVISKSLLEALSAHGEMLDSRAKEPKKYPGSNDEESRLAGMRGARARRILKQAVPAAAGEDLEAQFERVRADQFVVSLVGQLLENGLAQVILHKAGARSVSCRRVQVHYFGSRAAPTAGFGFISYSAEDADAGYFGEILRLNWWVS